MTTKKKRNPRTQAILALLREGMSVREVAAAFDLSTQRVYTIRDNDTKRKAAGE